MARICGRFRIANFVFGGFIMVFQNSKATGVGKCDTARYCIGKKFPFERDFAGGKVGGSCNRDVRGAVAFRRRRYSYRCEATWSIPLFILLLEPGQSESAFHRLFRRFVADDAFPQKILYDIGKAPQINEQGEPEN